MYVICVDVYARTYGQYDGVRYVRLYAYFTHHIVECCFHLQSNTNGAHKRDINKESRRQIH